MKNTQWIHTSDEAGRKHGRFDGRADCVAWLAVRLAENERMIAQDKHTAFWQAPKDQSESQPSAMSFPSRARSLTVTVLLVAVLIVVHLAMG